MRVNEGIALHDLMPGNKHAVERSGIKNGFVSLTSQHTTTAIAINKNEERLVDEAKAFLEQLLPANDKYLHNDIALRDCPLDEPENGIHIWLQCYWEVLK